MGPVWLENNTFEDWFPLHSKCSFTDWSCSQPHTHEGEEDSIVRASVYLACHSHSAHKRMGCRLCIDLAHWWWHLILQLLLFPFLRKTKWWKVTLKKTSIESLDQIKETKLTSNQSGYIAEHQLSPFEKRTAVNAAVGAFLEFL